MKLSQIAAVFALLTFVFSAHAAETGDRMLQQELKQQQLKATTERVGLQLDAIIDEFSRNGIAGQDVVVLRTIRTVLGTLSEQDMKLVVEYLQSSRQAADPNASAKQATEAYGRQKMIITKLKALEAEYRRQAELYEVSIRLRELANRQSANMWLGVWLDKSTGSKPITSFDEGNKNNLKLQEIDQENIKDEVLLVLTRLDKLANEVRDGPTADAPKKAIEQVESGGLKPTLEDALKDLRESRVLSAIGNEKRARDQLRAISRMLVLSEDELELLRQALRELEQAIDQQKQVSSKTKAIEQKDDASKAETSQAEVMDSTDLVRRDIDNLAPIATEHLKRAMDSMQLARSALSANDDLRKKREKAPPNQTDALASLEQGRRALLEQLAKAEEANTPENKLAEMKELLERLQQLVKDEETLRDETAAADKNKLVTKAPKQGELKDTAQELQEKAGSDSPAAAESIGEAAEQMQKAQNSLANAQNNPAAQQAAIDALKKAEQQLSQDIAKLEQAEQDLASLEELLEKLSKVIEEQQQVESKTADEATKPENQPLKDLASKQDQLRNDTGALEQKAASPAPSAAERLAEAKEHMEDAKKELDKPAAKDAQPDQREALRDLYAAKREIEDQMDKLRDMLGLPPSDAELADAASMIEQAQREVDEAMAQMEEGALKPAGKNLDDAEGLVSPLTAGKMGQLPSSVQSALESAQGSLSSGSAQAAAGQGSPAQMSAAAAAQSLAQAQAALALAQAGLSSGMAQAGQGQGQGQGQAQGQGKGRGQGNPAQRGTGRDGNWRGSGGADGAKRGTAGEGEFTGLPARDRAAIQQSQGEKYPQEYGPLVEQYLKNLSDQGSGR